MCQWDAIDHHAYKELILRNLRLAMDALEQDDWQAASHNLEIGYRRMYDVLATPPIDTSPP